MRGFIQVVCVLAIAVGGGLITFGSKLEPQFNLADPAAVTRILNSYQDPHLRELTSLTSGLGMGFMILGILGLVAPWVNKLGTASAGEIGDNSARTIATIALWLAIATVLTFGVFRAHWTGATGMSVLLILVAVICATATATTAMIYGWRPWVRTVRTVSETDRQQAS
jgi:preprotein translocase subunit Sss1